MPQSPQIDKTVKVKGFTVEISGGSAVDDMWHTCTGGGLKIELATATLGPQPLDVTEIKLTGYVRPPNPIFEWVTETLAAPVAPMRNITITEVMLDGSQGRKFEYFDCFLTGYDFPKLDAASGELLTETATFKPQRVEVS